MAVLSPEYQREWRAKNPDRARAHSIKYRFGITVEEYDAFLSGPCGICRERPAEQLDHDHETGRPRGGLCGLCNRGLGQFGDSIARLLAAVRYVQKGGE